MRVLVVDDLRSFPFAAVYARDASGAVGLLKTGPWDQVWLDHDLGDGIDIGPVIDLLCERAVWDDPVQVGQIVVHTSNPGQGDMMVRVLRRFYDVVRVNAAAEGGRVPPPVMPVEV